MATLGELINWGGHRVSRGDCYASTITPGPWPRDHHCPRSHRRRARSQRTSDQPVDLLGSPAGGHERPDQEQPDAGARCGPGEAEDLQRFGGERILMPRHDALPPNLPPRGLTRPAAAAYVGVGVTKFDEMVEDGRMPSPKCIDNRKVWDLRDWIGPLMLCRWKRQRRTDNTWRDVDAS